MRSTLTRMSLIGLIVYGGYMAIGEQRIARHCEDEVKSLEKYFEAMLDSQSTTLEFRSLNQDPLFFSWLFHAPPNHAIAIQIQTKVPGAQSTSTLLRIPSQPTGHYGIIDLQFNTEGTVPPVIKQLEVHGPNFLKAEWSCAGASQYKSPSLLDLVVSDPQDAFRIIQERQSRNTMAFGMDATGKSSVLQCYRGKSVALCYFTEEETGSGPLMHREFIIRAFVDD